MAMVRRKKQSLSRVWLTRSKTIGLFFFFSLAIGIGCGYGGMAMWRWMQKPTSFPIKNIRIQGQLIHETPQEIQQVIQSRLSGGFFSLDVASVKQALLSLPWVSTVSFRRMWPNTLSIRIQEQQPIARFGKNGILNAKESVFYPDVKTIPSDLPELLGTVDQLPQLSQYYHAMDIWAQTLGLSISQIEVNDEQQWSLTLSNNIKVVLGRNDTLNRFHRFVLIYPKISASAAVPIRLVDLRYPNGLAVQYENP